MALSRLTPLIKKREGNNGSLRELVVSVLVEGILSNVLDDGEYLVEADLQELFGTSRSPIREALSELDSLGLVVPGRRQTRRVKRLTRLDMEEIVPIRAMLEGLAARWAFTVLAGDTVREIERHYGLMREAVEYGDAKSYWDRHVLFHDAFINASGNATLTDTLKPLRIKTHWYLFSLDRTQFDLESELQSHALLIEALRDPKGSAEAMEKAMRNHVASMLNRNIQLASAAKAIAAP
ncbi:MAG: putative D-xylose utilization operon transcriptional repressor [Desulfovibrio sp.]